MAENPSKDNSEQAPSFTELNDLICEKIGGKVIFSTDDWFASAENLIKADDAVFKPELFTNYGKWMDGWETRRKRIPGHDWCIIQLGAGGVIHGVDIDTSYFTGNFAPRVSIQAAALDEDLPARKGDRIGQSETEEERQMVDKLNSEKWTEILPMTVMRPGYKSTCHNYHKINDNNRYTHIRLNMYPDGGIARLHVFGQVVPDWRKIPMNEIVDLAAMLNGSICIAYSNAHFGHPKNMISPGRSSIMRDGWETARRLDRPPVLMTDRNGILQVPGSEWAVFKLGHPGVITKVEIDTNHFKGNFPDSCWIEACQSGESGFDVPQTGWRMLLPAKKLSAHKIHEFSELSSVGSVTHVRLFMAPDGGISRMRLWGRRQLGSAL